MKSTLKMIALFAAAFMLLFAFVACGDDPEPVPTIDTTVSFVALGTGATIDFSPTNLPDGVTYILTDDKTHSWNSASGFNGKVTATTYDTAGTVTFTQTFYLYGEEITGANSKRTVSMSVTASFGVVNFASLVSDSGTVTLKHP